MSDLFEDPDPTRAHWYHELGKVIKFMFLCSSQGVVISWFGENTESVSFSIIREESRETIKGFKVGQWFECETLRENCMSLALSIRSVRPIDNLDKPLSNEEWDDIIKKSEAELPPFNLKDL